MGIRARAACGLALAALGVAGASPAHGSLIYGITTDNTLFGFDSASPGTLTTGLAVTGFVSNNEFLRAIDFRPATGDLYAISNLGRLYTLDTNTAVLSPVGAGVGVINGTAFGFDFNPVIDRIRLTSNTDKNSVLNPNTGALDLAATDLAFGPADPNVGINPNVVGSAYTNNVVGAGSTQLYAIDAGLDVLATQANNTGVLTTVGPLLTVNTSDLVGFDIEGGTNIAYASLTPAGGSVSDLYTINLATGTAVLAGQINGGTMVADISVVVPEPAAAGLGVAAVAGLAFARRRRTRR